MMIGVGTKRVHPKGFEIESFTFTFLLDCADDDWDAWGWRQRLKGFEIESDFHNYSKLYPSDTILNQITIPKILEQ